MINYIKLRKSLKSKRQKGREEGKLEGEQSYIALLTKQSKNHQKQIDDITTGHFREIIDLNKNHRGELQLFEKEYQSKNIQIDKKIKRINSLVSEWENKVIKIRKMAAETHELNKQAKQRIYEKKKEEADVKDNENSLATVEADLDNCLRGVTISKNKVESEVGKLEMTREPYNGINSK